MVGVSTTYKEQREAAYEGKKRELRNRSAVLHASVDVDEL